MSKVLGIIAEYNPFHNGHFYHINQSKIQTNCKYTIAVIGGNFTQRGSCSLIDKWSKTKMAICNGVDLVIELPLLYSISSAENFAYGAVKILDSLKIVDDISFGSECPDINILNEIAEVLYQEPKEFKSLLSHELSKGISFPKARENVLMIYLNNIRRYSDVLSSPNNILGIEYLKALKSLNSSILPHCIERIECDYNSSGFNGNIASSTAIRNILKSGNYKILSKLMPESSYSILMENIKKGHVVSDISSFEREIIYVLRRMSIDEISNLPDVNEGLENTIKKAANSCNSVIEFLDIVKSKRFTNTRIQRIMLYALLGISKKDMDISKKVLPYIRILGFNERGKFLISEISKANPKLQLVTSVKKFYDSCSNKNLKSMIEKDIYATNVYTLGYEFNSLANLDYTKKIEERNFVISFRSFYMTYIKIHKNCNKLPNKINR